jgi:hypothetical protein
MVKMWFSKIVPCFIFAVAIAGCQRGKDISKDPAAVGQNVVLTGKVEEIASPTVSRLDTKRGELVVVAMTPPPDVKPGDRVSASGQIRRMTVVDVERQFGIDLAPEYEVRVDGQNILVANEIRKV